jgi:hypothetical protein
MGNINNNPNFLSNTDFRLLPCSKAVNSGNDLTYDDLYSRDLSGSLILYYQIDMGAFETTHRHTNSDYNVTETRTNYDNLDIFSTQKQLLQ